MTTAEQKRMWTERVRKRAVGALPPEKLLPDRQPAYVSSWIYVFGVATIAALVVVVGSGVIPPRRSVDMRRSCELRSGGATGPRHNGALRRGRGEDKATLG